MGKLAPIDRKQTEWEGLWWHNEYKEFSSAVLSLADIKKFKGKVRLYVRKNKNFNGGENGRPNYLFCLKDANSDNSHEWNVIDDDSERLYTEDEIRAIIEDVVRYVEQGYTDPDSLYGWIMYKSV